MEIQEGNNLKSEPSSMKAKAGFLEDGSKKPKINYVNGKPLGQSFASTAIIDKQQVPVTEIAKAKPGQLVSYAGTTGKIGEPSGRTVQFLAAEALKGTPINDAKAKAKQMGMKPNMIGTPGGPPSKNASNSVGQTR